MPSYVLSDGSNVVSMEPNYDIKFSAAKIESSHRSRSGANYRYKWGEFSRVILSIEHVTSADMTRVNSWWGANTPLRLFDINSTVVSSGYIVNAGKPIDSYIMPYTDRFGGTIELEGY